MPVQPSVSRKNGLSAKLLLALALASCSSFSHANRADLDLAFGVDGVVRLAVSNGGFNDVLVQPDGRIVAVGMSGSDWLIARFNSDGSLDSGFGNGGVRTVMPPVVSATNRANAVALDTSGRVLVAGGGYVMRFNTNGSLDPGYSMGGIYAPPLSAGQLALNISDIVASSGGGFLLSCTIAGTVPPGETAFHISALKLSAAGLVDTSFGAGGYATLTADSLDPNNRTYAVAQWNGNVYVAGSKSSRSFNSNQPILVRFTASGALDETFGNYGSTTPISFVTWDPNIAATELAVVPASGVMVAGAGAGAGGPALRTRVNRITSAGWTDPGFVEASIPRPSTPLISGLMIDGDGRGILATLTLATPIVASLLSDGSSDPDFGTSGQRDVPFDGQPAAALALQADGKYLLAGGVGSSVAYLARLRGTALIPPDVDTAPPAGATIAANGGVPAATQSLGAIEFTNRGGDDLVVSGCTVGAGFSVSAPFPLTLAQAAAQNVNVSCQFPATPLTRVSGTLTCTTNDPDEAQVSFALECTSGTGAGAGGTTAIPALGAAVQWLLGGLLALLAMLTLQRPFAARGAKAP